MKARSSRVAHERINVHNKKLFSFLLGLTGPNIASESGCSSGMVAVYLACESLRKRRSDVALAAGANLLLLPFEKKHMVNVASPDGRCKTFDGNEKLSAIRLLDLMSAHLHGS